MKILKVDLQGFGPFRRPQSIDFTRFAEEGLFLIGGKTGAGKSSILDAITFALYGQTPRFEGAARGVRSNFADLTEESSVSLEFEHGGKRYRVTRSPEYEAAKKRGTGTTTRKSEAFLEQWQADQWRGTADSPRVVDEKLREIFPLSATEFLQVVMLAQNQFQKFLQAESKDRQHLLRKLFRTERYKTVSDLLAERAKESGQKLARLQDKLAEDAERLERRRHDLAPDQVEIAETEPQQVSEAWLQACVQLAKEHHHRSEAARHQAAATRTEAAAHLQRASELRNRQERRDKAQASRRTLLADQDRMQQEVINRLEIDAQAAPLVPVIKATQRAVEQLTAATESYDKARQRLTEELQVEANADRPAMLDAAANVSDIRRVARTLTEEMGSLRENEAIETLISKKAKDVAEAREATTRAQGDLDALQQQIAVRPAIREERVAALSTATEAAAGIAAATEALAKATEQLQAVKALPAAEQNVTDAAQELERALAAATAATDAERELINRRWLGAASYLAGELVDGEPCSVCGATEHPDPARSEVAEVSDEELQAAERAVKQAQVTAETHRNKRGAASQEAERIRTLAAGLDLENAEARHTAAKETLAAAQAAEKRIATLQSELSTLDAAAASDDARLVSLNSTRDEARSQLATLEAQLRDLRTRAEALRGKFASVKERLARTRAMETACQYVVSAAEILERAEQQLAQERAQLATALADSPFETSEAAAKARLTEATRKLLETERETHAKNLHVAEQTLAEPELKDLPEEAIELESPTRSDREAQVQLDAANQALGAAETLLQEIRTTVKSATATLNEIAAMGARAAAERELANALNGQNERKQNLEAFILAAYLEEVLAAANARLGSITANRYELELDDDLASRGRQSGLGLKIFDVYNGKTRAPNSLSGGETFLVSLALALGLADVVSAQAGGIALDTLFVDEGFGSLDSDTLEVAMRTLDQLREGGRMIGVISHVTSMQERIPAHLNVLVSADGSSDISTDVLAEPILRR
ncbi:AAA family ATPase [Gulosibacter chungangensis]|uniref:Nuclease SbcCD subunit C n=1 Tax=Gulosibacter chungangensis TaxID=979746 RepID=A0A7J5BCL7_9MICO|nr:SMC family ATPase [Gulosibacter chungangensis]KAB1643958.1 SMC family ATPase [Gulosibacter chungangensis]